MAASSAADAGDVTWPYDDVTSCGVVAVLTGDVTDSVTGPTSVFESAHIHSFLSRYSVLSTRL